MGSESGEEKTKRLKVKDNINIVNSSVNKLTSLRGGDFKNCLQKLTCIYTNADSFLNKFDEFKNRYLMDSEKPDIIAIIEVLPKNSR